MTGHDPDEYEWDSGDSNAYQDRVEAGINCANCGDLIRPTEARDGIARFDSRYEYDYVHDDGNPFCPIPCIATPPAGSTT